MFLADRFMYVSRPKSNHCLLTEFWSAFAVFGRAYRSGLEDIRYPDKLWSKESRRAAESDKRPSYHTRCVLR